MLLSEKEVMTVGVRERILAIRLMEKVNANPAAAGKLGIAVAKGLCYVKKQNNMGKQELPELR